MKAPIFPLLLVSLACASSHAPTYTAADAEPCDSAVHTDTAPWQLVRARGFTFCVPGEWIPTRGRSASGIDAHTWRGPGASITWSDEPERELAPVVIVMPGERPPSPDIPSTERRVSETIDGRTAELRVLDSGGRIRTSVRWKSPRIRISGEARTRELGMLQLDIYRTVRFAP